ncbi:hypothetical protein E4P41_04305 [Geodermatophilus sp. DF01-2]|uniref:hypothetical protein n=1 Tax=Geodermatophilus sp. DF01-2 TaxID=2559610 RepID=UPI0010746EA3|nr:hypothetical protein [Geodermatophilus sp. DF01_2]TFV63485.1 hypothetical protein E4P41_04305 [Geodermatophilus sp. DF01_2]
MAIAATTGLLLTGCGEETPAAEEEPVEDVLEDVREDESPADEPEIPFEEIPGDELVEPVFDGLYDEGFLADIDAYLDREVVLSGEVADVLSETAFAMTAAGNPAVEPIVVVTPDPVPAVEPGAPVRVAGTLEAAFQILAVEEEQGIELEDPLFEEYAGSPFLLADTVEVTSG